MVKLLAGVVANGGKVTNGGSIFWWQSYQWGQMMAMQQKELSSVDNKNK